MRLLDAPTEPVAPFASLSGPHAALRDKELSEVDVAVLARLVRLRLALERGQGWALLGLFGCGLLSCVVVGQSDASKAFVGVYAAAMASATAGLGLVVERVWWRVFRARARAEGLSERACEQLFEKASSADHWLEVAVRCGHKPTDAEVASFVLGA